MKEDVIINFPYPKNNSGTKNSILYKILSLGLLIVFSLSVYTQDTNNQEFWFVVPDASQSHDDQPVFFMITAGGKQADVEISMPANSSFTKQEKTLQPYESWKVTFGDHINNPNGFRAEMNLLENSTATAGQVTNKGILIKSTAPISAYYQLDGYKAGQKEIFTLKAEKALGSEFYTPFQTYYLLSSSFNGEAYRQIHIVAVDNATDVTFKAPSVVTNTKGTAFSANQEYTIRLNRGQTLLLKENVRNSGLMGTHIKTDSGKRIAVTIFEDCVESYGQDPIGDQIVPINNVGTNYIVVKGYSELNPNHTANGTKNTVDHVYILATEDNTVVKKDGVVMGTISKGQHLRFDIGDGYTDPMAYYLETSKPAYCFHQSAVEGELGGALIPSMYSISSRNISFHNQGLPINSIFLIYRESGKSSFRIKNTGQDEKPLAVNNSVSVDGWLYSKQDLEKVAGTTTISNTEGSFALGYFASPSKGSTALYGYLSNFGDFSLGADTIYHCGDSYKFDGGYAKNYEWTDPDGDVTTNSTLTATKSGKYKLKINQDPNIIITETYLKLQNFDNALLSAPERLLVDKAYNFTIELDKTDKDNIFRAAYEWDFGEGATIKTGSLDKSRVEVFYSSPGERIISLKITNNDAGCETTIIRTIEVLDKSKGLVMYWKTGAQDRNWNNEDNWTDAAGEPLSVVPSDYTKVYLPGNATKYPSLKDDKDEHTNWSYYGQPEAKEIVFRYGSELHYQHRLKYEKVYVNYNWGYYDGNFSDEQPDKSWENAKKLARDTWYILAAPLKSMASGDFSLAGYPFSWQKQFQVATNPQGSVAEGDFSKAFPTNDVPLAGTNNAIAIKMAGYKGETGHSNHKNLEGLHGVIEIPYFEDKTVIPNYPAHNYDALSKKSYFYYFDTKTLKILNSLLGSMSRAGEAYRFIYETANNELPTNEVYEMTLNNREPGSANEVMIGNPLLAPIDAKAFADANTNKIDAVQGYKLLSDNGSTWEQKFFTEGNTIPAWKAFIVTLQPSVSTISFPLEAIALRAVAASRTTRTSYNTDPADNALSMHILKKGIESGDHAILQNNRDANNTEIRKMILPEGHEAPEIFFMSSGRDLSYLIRNLQPGEKEVPIGVKTSDVRSRLSLQFGNIQAFSASTGASVILVDKYLNARQDLTRNPLYSFTQQASGLDKQYVDRNRFALQLGGEAGAIGPDDPENGIDIMYLSGILKITSDENIDAVSVYDLYGRLVFSARSINLSQYTYPVSSGGKLLLVQVKTVSGTVKVKKIMGD